MRRLLATVVLLSASAVPGQAFGLSPRAAASPHARPSVREQTTFAGAWVGKTPDNQFQVLLEIFDSDDELEGFVVEDDGADALNATAFGTQLNLELADPLASFKGRLHPDGAQIVGRWKQGDSESWLVFERLTS